MILTFDESPRPYPSKAWKKKYRCKKLKGDHDYRIEKLWPIRWFKEKVPYWVIWRCRACTKKAYEMNVPNKKFDKYRHTIYEKDIPIDWP